jgi:hypothetical protein
VHDILVAEVVLQGSRVPAVVGKLEAAGIQIDTVMMEGDEAWLVDILKTWQFD